MKGKKSFQGWEIFVRPTCSLRRHAATSKLYPFSLPRRPRRARFCVCLRPSRPNERVVIVVVAASPAGGTASRARLQLDSPSEFFGADRGVALPLLLPTSSHLPLPSVSLSLSLSPSLSLSVSLFSPPLYTYPSWPSWPATASIRGPGSPRARPSSTSPRREASRRRAAMGLGAFERARR